MNIFQDTRVVLAAVSVASLAAGAAGGYFVAYKRLSAQFDERMIAETENTRQYYALLNKKDEFETPEKAARAQGIPVEETKEEDPLFEAYEKVVGDHGYSQSHPALQKEDKDELDYVRVDPDKMRNYRPDPEVVKNIFDAAPKDSEGFVWDYSLELKERMPENPYVIHHDEWTDNELGHEQLFLTYYEYDNVVADGTADVPIDDLEYTVGADNLNRFGHGSEDPRIVYVRNERLGIDYEITFDSGSFEDKVLGVETRLKGLDDNPGKIRKFRSDDE